MEENDIISETVETYAIFKNVDDSILNANFYLEKYGYKFCRFNLQELETYFSDFFSYPKHFKSNTRMGFQGSDMTVSMEFYDIFHKHYLFGNQVSFNRNVIFLKRIEDFEREIINNTFDSNSSMKVSATLEKFVSILIQQFRLFKNGDIECPTEFQITKKNRNVISRHIKPPSKNFDGYTYTITPGEAEILFNNFTEEFKSNHLTELALRNFNLSYQILDLKIKYITLMTCLESLFNHGADQITHIVSRHLAIIISKDDEEFHENYKNIKKMYGLRSTIVHGDTVKGNLAKYTDDLQNKVRQAINYCLTLSDDKKQLFERLNSFGFRKEL